MDAKTEELSLEDAQYFNRADRLARLIEQEAPKTIVLREIFQILRSEYKTEGELWIAMKDSQLADMPTLNGDVVC